MNSKMYRTQKKNNRETLKIEKGIFIKCGHRADLKNTYRYRNIVTCNECKRISLKELPREN